MVSLFALWLPIVLSAILVFIVSSLIHMLIGWHKNDYKKLPGEDRVLSDLRNSKIPAGDYIFPYSTDSKERTTPEFQNKVTAGPAGVMTIYPAGKVNLTSSMAQWFVYCIIVGMFAAYISGRALYPGAHYLSVFRFAGATAFIGYSLALMQQSIWWRKKWSATIMSMFDGLIYALLTAGIFGWLWPA